MMNMMKDLDGAEMNKQLETLGLSPSEVINKIMAEPELAAAFQKPKVMQVTQPAPAARTQHICTSWPFVHLTLCSPCLNMNLYGKSMSPTPALC